MPTSCVCETCEKSFSVPGRVARRFCSRPCSRTPLFKCTLCGKESRGQSSRQKTCDSCVGSKMDRHRFNRYGVTGQQWQDMVAKYRGLCWICMKAPATCVDHDHDTGKVRGALCRVCNMALHYHEDRTWTARAAMYLMGK